ncbi:hypothetical protein EV702DRAFT_1105230 [Suillus placidus]|uniref:C2H2-type domain-containing protein n=1 Tax=Suillus placidus TaxID=48579 RepID=A0A9P6ZV59_9AGAM|nr:hypothetical protein EV702DRAFT_1105230 [Suillus placidus]
MREELDINAHCAPYYSAVAAILSMSSPPARKEITPPSLQKFEGHTYGVTGAIHLPGGQRMITCPYHGSLREWNLEAAIHSATTSRSQCGQPLWYNPFPPSLQAMTSQPSTEPLFIMNLIPPPEQSECAWTEDGKRCGHPILNAKRKLGMHLRDFHGVQGNDKKSLVCFWQGCSRKMQRGAIGRHIISCHLKTRFTCKNCLKTYSRSDAMKKHAKDCQAA